MPTSAAPDGTAQTAEELFLLRLRYKEGRLVESGSNKPILLDDDATAWVVYTGQVDLFAVEVQDGQVMGPRQHLCRLVAGQALFGLSGEAAPCQMGVLAVGIAGTQLVRLKRGRLLELAHDPEDAEQVIALVETWVAQLSAVLPSPLPPSDVSFLEPGQPLALAAGRAGRPRKAVLWLPPGPARLSVGGEERLALSGATLFPLAASVWVQADADATLTPATTRAVVAEEAAWSGLAAFHHLVLRGLALRAEQAARDQRRQLEQRQAANRLTLHQASQRLAAILDDTHTPVAPDAADDPLLAACRVVGAALGVVMRPPPGSGRGVKGRDPLEEIARASRLRWRRVTLPADWWRQDGGPLLGFLAPDRPVALLPGPSGTYDLVDPAEQTRRRVDSRGAASVAPHAYAFYRPFPDRLLRARDIVGFGLHGQGRNLGLVVLMGLAGGALGMLTPLATGQIIDWVIPAGHRDQLVFLALGLAVAAVGAMLFEITRAFAMLRIETGLDASIQAAVWDRLLSLPVPFFRQYATGDLATRAMGINTIRQVVTGASLSAILAGVFSVFNFALLFFYNGRLALTATLVTAIIIAATTVTSYLQLRQQHLLTEMQGKISGTVLQLLTGIAKLRVAGAEPRAFALWARQFAAQRTLAFKARSVANAQTVFNAGWPVLTSMALFGVIALAPEGMSIGRFLAFNAAFGQFLFAALAMTGALTSILQAIPFFERAKPILETLPEVASDKLHPGELTGAIELSRVSFRYKPDGPLVLNDVSLRIEPGQFVAVVGPSGAGKSSLFRLLLGFETPEAGSIYYDGHDLAGLDVQAVRRQIGVVLQHGKLTPGSMLENIIGSSLLTVDDAWAAARMAGLDDDIRQMPMGMYTMIAEGASTLSGGQRQRLLIARAIVAKPRLLLFDEATSALDNRTQAIVSQSLENLQATRIVIAHRLSTILHADRIFVLEGGRVVQSGTYAELLNQPGLFQALAARQLA